MATGTDGNDRRFADACVEAPVPPHEPFGAIEAVDGRPSWAAPMSRRNALSLAALSFTAMLSLGLPGQARAAPDEDRTPGDLPDPSPGDPVHPDPGPGESMRIHYLEVVTPEVDPVCALYSQVYGVTFGEADPALGGARTAPLANGGMIGIRAPLNEGERPVARPYVLVEDIDAAVAAAVEVGARISLPPMEIPGRGTCAIVFQGGIESGLWQL